MCDRIVRTRARRGGRGRRAFTLLEIMLVVIIIGILASIVVVNLGGISTDAKISSAKGGVAQLRTALGLFEQRYNHYPAEEEGGLRALLERPSTISESEWRRFGDSEPIDPWGNQYIYLIGSRRIDKNRDFNLYSMGPNKQDDAMQGDDIQ